MNTKTNKTEVVVIGAANIDIVGCADRLIKCDSAMGSIHHSHGGVARNIAEAVAKLGGRVGLITVVGNDQQGDHLISALNNEGVKTHTIFKIDGIATGSYMALLDRMGDMHYAINDMAIVEQLTAQRIMQFKDVILAAKTIVVDANLSYSALQAIFDLGHKKVIADGVSASKVLKYQPFLKCIYGIKPNLNEMKALTGLSISSQADALKAIDILHQKGIQRVVLTMAEKGVIASDGKRIIKYQMTVKNVVNATGAGDAFTAQWALCETLEVNFFDMVKRGMIVAYYTLKSPLTIPQKLSYKDINKQVKEVKINETILRHSS